MHGATTILLDGKPVRLPGGTILAVPAEPLADAIAQEWGEAQGTILPDSLPLTRIAGTAQTRIAADPGPTIDAIAKYGEADLLCYRADAPAALAERQDRLWQPWLDWSANVLSAPLTVHTGVIHHPQPPQSLARLRAAVAAHPPWRLAGLGIAVPALGSLVLGIALAAQELDPQAAHELALLDELFETESWGADLAAAARRDHIRQDIEDAARFMNLAA